MVGQSRDDYEKRVEAQIAKSLYRDSEQLQAAMVGQCSNSTIMQLGCGMGRLSPWANDMCNYLIGVDDDPDNIENAVNLYPEINFSFSVYSNLPFGDNFFDGCVSWETLEHKDNDEKESIIDEIKRVCNGSGLIILQESDEPTEYYEKVMDPYELIYSEEKRDMDSVSGGNLMLFSIPESNSF